MERSFKIRSRIHGKERVQLSNNNVKKQGIVIYNTVQIQRCDVGEFATKRLEEMERLLILRYSKFVETNGSKQSELISDQYNSSAVSWDDIQHVLLNEDLFKSVEAFPAKIDSILSWSK